MVLKKECAVINTDNFQFPLLVTLITKPGHDVR